MNLPRKLRNRICVVDSFVAETGTQAVPTQGALLADYLAKEGLFVIRTSSEPKKLKRALDMAATLVRCRSEYDVTLIQVFGLRAFQYAQVSSWIARRLKKKVVLVLRSGGLPEEWRRQPRRLQRVFRRADSIVAPSSYLASTFQEVGYQIEVIPNFIEIERYPFRCRGTLRPCLFWVRAFHPKYNPQMAIETFALLKRKFPDAVLSMGGPDAGELDVCRRLAASLGVADSVHFLGFLTKAQIVAEAAKHDIHLHTNRVDNTPVTLLENMALGLPIVATRVGGVPHLVRDGQTALLVENEDIQGMAAAVDRLLTTPQLATELSQAGRQFVKQNCTWMGIRDAWLSVLGKN